jgi:hypothetical protein
MMLEPGDRQLANDDVPRHSRTEFEDFAELSRRRRFMRRWVKMPNTKCQGTGARVPGPQWHPEAGGRCGVGTRGDAVAVVK